MSKKPVPKKQQSKSSSRSRHSKYVAEQRKRMSDDVQLVKCSHCGENDELTTPAENVVTTVDDKSSLEIK